MNTVVSSGYDSWIVGTIYRKYCSVATCIFLPFRYTVTAPIIQIFLKRLIYFQVFESYHLLSGRRLLNVALVMEGLMHKAAIAVIMLLLVSCASYAPTVGTIAQPEDASTILGYFRYYVVHSSYGQLARIDTTWLSSATYAVKVAPGPHLVQISMDQVSVMNPLIIGSGNCAFILDTALHKTYQLRPPAFSAYWHFWSHPALPLVESKLFLSSIEITISDGNNSRETISVPMACESGNENMWRSGLKAYCRVASDCEDVLWKEHSAEDVQNDKQPECEYDANFPVGICSSVLNAN